MPTMCGEAQRGYLRSTRSVNARRSTLVSLFFVMTVAARIGVCTCSNLVEDDQITSFCNIQSICEGNRVCVLKFSTADHACNNTNIAFFQTATRTAITPLRGVAAGEEASRWQWWRGTTDPGGSGKSPTVWIGDDATGFTEYRPRKIDGTMPPDEG
jgi:hypothetical protein